MIRNLRVYAQAMGASLYGYREGSGLEADAILELADGRWAAIEVKLGPDGVPAAAVALRRIADHVDTARHGEPAFLAVITGWGFGHRRPDDGVLVVPVGTLGP